MTHEELLAKIDKIHNTSSDIGEPANKTYKGMLKFQYALRAVVELHKPDDAGFCSECFGTPYVTYPCSTIQAIEKELK